MNRLIVVSLLIGLSAGLTPVVGWSKQYNERSGMPPSANAKIARIKAKTKNQDSEDSGGGSGSGDVINNGCGRLDIGRIENAKRGQRIDRDIIITGDIINLGAKCR